jgi:hypothetical protein
MDLRVSARLRRVAMACCFGFGALALWASPAAAQDSPCPALTPPPTLADGAEADADAMRATDAAYQAWATARIAALQCYRDIVQPLVAENQARRAAHDAGVAYLTAISAAWRTQADIFNARSGAASSSATAVDMPAPPAADEAGSCPALHAAAQIPNGAAASRAEIDAYNQQYMAWGTAFRAALECRAQVVTALEARLAPSVTAYNSGNTELGAQNTAWAAEVAEYEARSPVRNRRSNDDRYGAR